MSPAQLALAAAVTASEDEVVRHTRGRSRFLILTANLFSTYWPVSGKLYAYLRFSEIIASMGRSDWLRDRGAREVISGLVSIPDG